MPTPLDRLMQVGAAEDLGRDVLEVLEGFLVEELGKSGVWHGRESDGVSWARSKSADATSISICGEVWAVGDQERHAFWLDLVRDRGTVTGWRLHYDLDEARMTARARRDALLLVENSGDVPWRFTVPSGM